MTPSEYANALLRFYRLEAAVKQIAARQSARDQIIKCLPMSKLEEDELALTASTIMEGGA